ncbi:MAG: hypothetical protein ACI9G9_001370 [Psychromonas sp.]|jgi:hypothetical protein
MGIFNYTMKSILSFSFFVLIVLIFQSCGSTQYAVEDDLYSMKSSELPFGENLLDETSYETFKYRTKKNNKSDKYYAPENGGVLDRSPLFRPRMQFVMFYGNFSPSPYFYPNSYYHNPYSYWGQNPYNNLFYSPYSLTYFTNPCCMGGYGYNASGTIQSSPTHVGPRFVHDGISSRKNYDSGFKLKANETGYESGFTNPANRLNYQEKNSVTNSEYRSKNEPSNNGNQVRRNYNPSVNQNSSRQNSTIKRESGTSGTGTNSRNAPANNTIRSSPPRNTTTPKRRTGGGL